MATLYNRHVLPGRRPSNLIDPLAYAQQQEANRQADIKARAEAAQLLSQQKTESEAAKLKAQTDLENIKRAAAFNALTTKTNADWNLHLAKQSEKNKPAKIRVTSKDGDVTTTREFTPEEFAADKKAKELADLTAKRDLLKSSWFLPGLRGIPGKVADTEKQIEALQSPADVVAPAVAAISATPTPTPRGFIGSPGRNTFLNEPAPLGMNREQVNAYAIDLNNRRNPAPRDLLKSESFPAGYDPGHGSFQVDAAPAPAPVPADAGMIPLTPGPEDAPAIPQSHIQHLIANPQLADYFDEKYGSGASAKFLQDAAPQSQP